MLTFLFGILGLLLIIGIISLLDDFKNSAIKCVLGIVGFFVIYALVTGTIDFFLWLSNQIGSIYAILVMILLIVSPILFLFFYDDLKSNKNIISLTNALKNNKKIISISIIIILLIVIGFVIFSSPLDLEPYTVECPEGYSIFKDTSEYPVFDGEFKGYLRWNGNASQINVWHHNAHGKDLKYYLDKMENYNPIEINKIKNISIDGESAYKIKGSWATDDDEFVVFIHDDECYLIYFNDDVPNETKKEFLDSFKFK